ncbi:MAG: restriction endonuclease [Flavobacteriales bacterium]|nr:MAG: restriction endonuclease [Flavobacteriales bacterium]
MLNPALSTYAKAFSHLQRGSTPYGLAPHKPILLLSIIELIEKGIVADNRVFVDDELIGTFKENWQLLVTTANIEDVTQPFYHLQNDQVEGKSFWLVYPKPGYQITKTIKSLVKLAEVCAFGALAEELWLLLLDAQSREFLRQVLLDTYFPEQIVFYRAVKQVGEAYLQLQTQSILNDAAPKYGKRRLYTMEEVIVRDGLFQRWVTNAYDYQCSFTGMKLSNSFNYNFVDACHIVPFAVSFNDSRTNGIALCPNMHRAFDRGLLSIDEDYRILVSEHLTENKTHPYALNVLKGRQIILPQQQNHYPAQEALAWHRGEVFKN